MSTQNKFEEPSYLEYKGKYKGIFSWILSTDHKRIALLYLFSLLTFFAIGATLGLLMKLELIAPGKTIMTAPAILNIKENIRVFFPGSSQLITKELRFYTFFLF